MTSASPVSRVVPADGDDPGTVVECTPCGLLLRVVEAFDRDVALGTFFSHHPASPDAVHQPDVPAGWIAVTAPAA